MGVGTGSRVEQVCQTLRPRRMWSVDRPGERVRVSVCRWGAQLGEKSGLCDLVEKSLRTYKGIFDPL